jgi:DNA-binding response OmpR family regulator
VADPSGALLRTLQLVLPEPEYKLYPAGDGEALKRLLDEVEPDAVLASLSLPGVRSADVVRLVRGREASAGVPLIGLHGTFEPYEAGAAELAEFDLVVQKPFDSEEFAAGVRDLIASKTGPVSLPEIPDWRDAAADSAAGGPDKKAGPAAGVTPLGEEVKGFIRQEVAEMERELEKRLKARLMEELGPAVSRQGPGRRE